MRRLSVLALIVIFTLMGTDVRAALVLGPVPQETPTAVGVVFSLDGASPGGGPVTGFDTERMAARILYGPDFLECSWWLKEDPSRSFSFRAGPAEADAASSRVFVLARYDDLGSASFTLDADAGTIEPGDADVECERLLDDPLYLATVELRDRMLEALPTATSVADQGRMGLVVTLMQAALTGLDPAQYCRHTIQGFCANTGPSLKQCRKCCFAAKLLGMAACGAASVAAGVASAPSGLGALLVVSFITNMCVTFVTHQYEECKAECQSVYGGTKTATAATQ